MDSSYRVNLDISSRTVIDDEMVQVLWIKHFQEAQSEHIAKTTIFQDNKVEYYWLNKKDIELQKT